MKILDLAGSAIGLIDTTLLIRASIIAWPFGIMAIIINFFLYYDSMLYADMCLQIIYLVSMFYGWYYWLRGGQKKHNAAIVHITLTTVFRLFIVAILGTGIVYWLLAHFTPSTTPLWDAATTVFSLIAQWMVCRKIIENWLLWLLIDSLYAGLYYHKGLPFHTLEHTIYLLFAVVGYMCWQKKMRRQTAKSIPFDSAVTF